MIYNFVVHFSMWLLVTLLLLMTNSSYNAVEGIKVIGSTNVSTVQVGQPFTFKCEVTEYELNEDFEIWFFYSITNSYFAGYRITEPKFTNEKTNFFIYYYNDIQKNISKKYFSQLQPLVHRYPTYEVSITPKTAFSTEFYCNFLNASKNLYFNHVSVTVYEKNQTFPQLNMNSSISAIHLNEPFTLTCSLSDFDPENKNYSVSFYSSRDSPLASYKIDSTGKSYLFAGEDELFSAHHGPRSAYPVFDLIVTERVNRRLEYWCELELVEKSSIVKKYQSPHWKSSGPFVDFTATYNTTTAEHRGKCSVDDFARHTSTEYKVQFYSSLGPKVGGDNLLAYYWVQPNATPEFVHELHQSPWTSITAGSSIFYPNFEIVASVLAGSDSKGKQWWCVLSIGEQIQANYRQIKSNVQLI